MNTNPKCPRCGGEITRGEPKCKHCGVLLKWKNPLQKEETKGETAPAGAITVRLPPPPTPESPQNAGAGAGARFCPQCGKKLVAGQRFCPGCGAAAGGGARPGFGRPSHGNGNPPEGMRRLTVDERPPSFTEAWGRGWRFSWKGRATRQEYWFRILSLLIECLILGGVAGAILGAGGEDGAIVLMGVYGLAACIPSLCLFIRRLHDTGRSGFWFFVLLLLDLPGTVFAKSTSSQDVRVVFGLLSFAATIMSLIFVLLPSDGANQWGPDPHKPFARKIQPHK